MHFLQIWIVPAVKGVEPRYQQEHFSPEQKRGAMRLIISSDGADGSLVVRQDARIYVGMFDGDERTTLQLPAARYAYVHVARGKICVNGIPLSEGDGARVRDEGSLTFSDGDGAEVLVFDLRPIEEPSC